MSALYILFNLPIRPFAFLIPAQLHEIKILSLFSFLHCICESK